MIRTTRAFTAAKTALVVACLAYALLALATGALAAESPPAQTPIDYQKESLQEYEQQLAGGQIAAVTINKLLRSLRVTLKDGRHVLARYDKHQEPTVAAALKAKGVPVTVLVPAAAQQEAKHRPKPAHHKLRYIAGGIVIVVILVVGAVLLVDRRRKLAAE
jgi:hypothetical protein